MVTSYLKNSADISFCINFMSQRLFDTCFWMRMYQYVDMDGTYGDLPKKSRDADEEIGAVDDDQYLLSMVQRLEALHFYLLILLILLRVVLILVRVLF